ncbi:MAG: FeoA family protein [Desulfurococcaceae archaeon]
MLTNPSKILTLDSVKTGKKVAVKDFAIHEWAGLISRLAYMGILPGTEIEVVLNENRGPLVIRVRGVEVSMSRGIAKKILVEELE